MPHDARGDKLAVGDRVDVPCVVTSIGEQPEYCNVSVETLEPCHPGTNKTTLSLNGKQVFRASFQTKAEPSGPPAPETTAS